MIPLRPPYILKGRVLLSKGAAFLLAGQGQCDAGRGPVIRI